MEKEIERVDFMKKEEECPDCEIIRKGLVYIGDPPKCRKHRKKIKIHREWSRG